MSLPQSQSCKSSTSPPWSWEFVDAVYEWWPNSEKLMAMLWKAYLDESVTKDKEGGGGKVYSVSCLIAPCHVWKDFSCAWSDAMERCGAGGKILHMKSLVHSKEEWAGWVEAQKKRLFAELVSVIHSHSTLRGYCGSIPLDAFEEIYAPSVEQGEPITPYQLILQGTMESIIDSCEPSKENPVVFFMERNQLIEADLTHQFYHLTTLKNWGDIFPTITAVPKGPQPLQLADMVVYEGSTYSSRHEVGTSKRHPRKLYQRLNETPGFVFITASRQLLIDHVNGLMNLQEEITPEETNKINAGYEVARKRMQRERNKVTSKKTK